MKHLPLIAGGSPVRTQYLVFGRPLIGEEEISEVSQSIRSGWVGTVPKDKKFEEMFKKFIDTGKENFRMLNSSQIRPSLYLFQGNLLTKMSRM